MTDLSYCAAQVRTYDRDRFLCSLFAPAEERVALSALYAFNIEVASVRERVSQPLLGAMRLQWWRDAIDAVFEGRPPSHAVAAPLAAAVARYRLDRTPFSALLAARARDVEDAPPADVDELVAYAEATSASLVTLSLQILGGGGGAEAAGRHVGIAWALTGLMRAVPYHARQRRLYLPADLQRRAGLDPEALFRGGARPGLAVVVEEIVGLARDHLRRAREVGAEVPRQAVPALLPATLADGYLAALERCGHDPFDRRLRPAGAGAMLRLAARAWRQRF